MEDMVNKIREIVATNGLNILFAIAVFVIGKWIVAWLASVSIVS